MFDYYEHDRVQIIGSKEGTFFHWLEEEDQQIRTKMLFEKNPPAFIFSKNVNIPDLFIKFGNEYNIPILNTSSYTNGNVSKRLLIICLEKHNLNC